ncbi:MULTISPECIES: hypothetical protein [Wolbachia]|uniref:Uncharacterized protein n=1 Tax=Wolbachia pipientis TaxID=955 RepID=A0A7G5CBP2_WOLPI|nr:MULTISPECIES: hypothetical protein [Wolbachia]MDE5061500.1 hypothetical protein [Wolbachia endosymbiont of Drosophila nikananu]QMV46626.1 hypothetical protein HC356_00325 [Wolbachia pipientis]
MRRIDAQPKPGKESSHTASQVPQEKSVNQDKLNATLSNDNNKQKMQEEEYYARVERVLKETKEIRESHNDNPYKVLLNKMAPRGSESDHSSDWAGSGDKLSNSGGWSDNENKEQDKQSFAPAQADASIDAAHEIDSDEEVSNYINKPLNSQLGNGERSKTPDSAYGSKSSSPLNFESETEKPQVPASLQEEPSVTKVNNVDPVNSRV